MQKGEARAKYGEALLVNLSKDLTRLGGRGFSRSNLSYMRKFYLAFPKYETVSHKLGWSHYFELLKCDDTVEMQFYMHQAIRENWSVRGLKRQINSSLFQRLALSTDKAGILAMAQGGHQVSQPSDILVFYHAILKCYVLIDLKRSEIKHQDIGQMNMYINYFKTEICQPDDNPPIGIVLGAKKDELLMEYALAGIDNNLFAARYQLYLPNKAELQAQLNQLMED